MKVDLIFDESLEKNHIIIRCFEQNDKVNRIKCYAEKMDARIIAKINKETVFITPDEVYYIESIDKKTFLYTAERVLECDLRLYEIEELLFDLSFIRISKSCIVNVSLVKRISVMINRGLMLEMDNGEKIVVSRRYVKKFNKLIGME